MNTMSNKNTFKIPSNLDSRWNKLNLTAKAIYATISIKSDFNTRKSHIKRETICSLLGLKDESIVTKYTNLLNEIGLIEKTYLDSLKLKAVYRIVDLDKFTLLKKDIIHFGLNDKQLGLYLSLCSLRWNNEVNLPYLYKECNVAKRTYYKYIKELEALKLVESDKGAITLLECIPIKSLDKLASKIWDDFKDANEKLPKDERDPRYTLLKELENNGWETISSPSKYVVKIISGKDLLKKESTKPIIYEF